MSDVREALDDYQQQIWNAYGIGSDEDMAFQPLAKSIDTYLNGPGAPERVALLEAVAGDLGSDAKIAALRAYDREHGISCE